MTTTQRYTTAAIVVFIITLAAALVFTVPGAAHVAWLMAQAVAEPARWIWQAVVAVIRLMRRLT